MTVRVGDAELVLDPYDYDFHEDPYPYYRRLRDEAPLYRNEERNFWAVSRHHDVLQGFGTARRCRMPMGYPWIRPHALLRRTG